MSGRVDIVIVNWNAGRQLAECIASIDAYADGHVASVTIVDNGSTDGSEHVTSTRVPLGVIAAGANLGFARACNVGAKDGSAGYVLLLNPDTRLYDGTLDIALGYIDRHPDVGVVGIQLHGDAGRAQHNIARRPTAANFVADSLGLARLSPRLFPGMFVDYDPAISADVDHSIGAFYLVRRALWVELGGLDEAFFVYLEDNDFSYRVRRRGYRVHYLAEATAYHRGGGTSEQVKAHRLSYALQSRIVFAAKHSSLAGLVAVAVTTLFVEPVIRLGERTARRSWSGVRDTARGYGLIYRALPALLRTVRAVRRR